MVIYIVHTLESFPFFVVVLEVKLGASLLLDSALPLTYIASDLCNFLLVERIAISQCHLIPEWLNKTCR